MTKTCCMCRLILPLDEFYRQRSSKDGRGARCKSCASEYSREWKRKNPERAQATMTRWRLENRESLLAYQRKYQAENADRRSVEFRKWRRANLEKERARSRDYYRANTAAIRARNRVWARDNIGRYIAQVQSRRELARRLTEEDREYDALLRRDPCAYCGGDAGTVDHIIPFARDGEIGWTNLTASCGKCNSSKGPADLLGFLRRRIFDIEREGVSNGRRNAA